MMSLKFWRWFRKNTPPVATRKPRYTAKKASLFHDEINTALDLLDVKWTPHRMTGVMKGHHVVKAHDMTGAEPYAIVESAPPSLKMEEGPTTKLLTDLYGRFDAVVMGSPSVDEDDGPNPPRFAFQRLRQVEAREVRGSITHPMPIIIETRVAWVYEDGKTRTVRLYGGSRDTEERENLTQ